MTTPGFWIALGYMNCTALAMWVGLIVTGNAEGYGVPVAVVTAGLILFCVNRAYHYGVRR